MVKELAASEKQKFWENMRTELRKCTKPEKLDEYEEILRRSGLLDKKVKLYIDTRRRCMSQAYPEVWRVGSWGKASKTSPTRTVPPEGGIGLSSSPFAQPGRENKDNDEAEVVRLNKSQATVSCAENQATVGGRKNTDKDTGLCVCAAESAEIKPPELSLKKKPSRRQRNKANKRPPLDDGSSEKEWCSPCAP